MDKKLSIVVTSRNDNHGGDMTRRMQVFITMLIAQCNKFKVPIELVFVEWNPPAGQPLLKDVLPKPQHGDYLELRYIVVPGSLHQQYKNADKIALYQMIAKNVGIRRAKSEFVLCTNVDVVFSDALFSFFATTLFDRNTFYRANRCDVPFTFNHNDEAEKILLFFKNNIIARHGMDSHFYDLVGLPDILTRTWFLRPLTRLFIAPFYRQRQMGRNPAWRLDHMACGDFTLMSKDAWLKMEGYVELDLYSLFIDSLGLFSALAIGLKQVVLPPQQCCYHINHADGWQDNFTPIQQWLFYQNKPVLNWELAAGWGQYAVKNKTLYGINKPDWGFANQQLQEYVFNAL